LCRTCIHKLIETIAKLKLVSIAEDNTNEYHKYCILFWKLSI